MSRGPSNLTENPLEGVSIWNDDTPKSARIPSTLKIFSTLKIVKIEKTILKSKYM